MDTNMASDDESSVNPDFNELIPNALTTTLMSAKVEPTASGWTHFQQRLEVLKSMDTFKPFLRINDDELMLSKPIYGIVPRKEYNFNLDIEAFAQIEDTIKFFSSENPIWKTGLTDPWIIITQKNWYFNCPEMNRFRAETKPENQSSFHWDLEHMMATRYQMRWPTQAFVWGEDYLQTIPMPARRRKERERIVATAKADISFYFQMWTSGLRIGSLNAPLKYRSNYICFFCNELALPDPLTCSNEMASKLVHYSCLESFTLNLELKELRIIDDILCHDHHCISSFPLRVKAVNLPPKDTIALLFKSSLRCRICGKYFLKSEETDHIHRHHKNEVIISDDDDNGDDGDCRENTGNHQSTVNRHQLDENSRKSCAKNVSHSTTTRPKKKQKKTIQLVKKTTVKSRTTDPNVRQQKKSSLIGTLPSGFLPYLTASELESNCKITQFFKPTVRPSDDNHINLVSGVDKRSLNECTSGTKRQRSSTTPPQYTTTVRNERTGSANSLSMINTTIDPKTATTASTKSSSTSSHHQLLLRCKSPQDYSNDENLITISDDDSCDSTQSLINAIEVPTDGSGAELSEESRKILKEWTQLKSKVNEKDLLIGFAKKSNRQLLDQFNDLSGKRKSLENEINCLQIQLNDLKNARKLTPNDVELETELKKKNANVNQFKKTQKSKENQLIGSQNTLKECEVTLLNAKEKKLKLLDQMRNNTEGDVKHLQTYVTQMSEEWKQLNVEFITDIENTIKDDIYNELIRKFRTTAAVGPPEDNNNLLANTDDND